MESETAGPSNETNGADTEPAMVRKRRREGMPTLVDELISTARVKVEQPTEFELSLDRPVSPSIHGATEDPKDDAPILEAQEPQVLVKVEKKPSMLHVSRSTSFATPHTAGPSDEPDSDALDHPPAADGVRPESAVPARLSAKDDSGAVGEVSKPITSSKFFEGVKFGHIIKDQKELFEKALLDHGGILVSEDDRKQGEEVDYVVMRLCV